MTLCTCSYDERDSEHDFFNKKGEKFDSLSDIEWLRRLQAHLVSAHQRGD